MGLSYFLVLNMPPAGNDLQSLLSMIATAGIVSSSFLNRKKLRKLKWLYLKNYFRSFFKKEKKAFTKTSAFWLLVAGLFFSLWLLVNLFTAMVVIGAGLLIFIIVANKKPSY